MARGIGAQILLLAVAAAALMTIAAIAVMALGVSPPNEKTGTDGFGTLLWRSMTHTLDAGTIANDGLMPWGFLFVMLFVTIGGLFVVSALISVLTQGFGQAIERLRRGRSAIVETGHTVILGWTPKVFTLLRELACANENRRGACVVVLADRDKVDMDSEIASAMHGRRLRVVTRTGNPMTIGDLGLVSLATSKAVIVLAPEEHGDGSPMAPHESDTVVMKTLLAIKKAAPTDKLHVVAEIFDEKTEAVARLVTDDKAGLILAAPLVSRLLVQTGRQSGLSVVYTELLDFEGVEIYIVDEPKLVGKTFRDAVFAYETSTVLGVLTAAGEMLVPPKLDRVFAKGDQIVAISEDDDTIILDGKRGGIDDSHIVATAPEHVHTPERVLILGASSRLPTVLVELDQYVAPGSEVTVVGEGEPETDIAPIRERLSRMRVVARGADITNRALLDGLDITSFDHVLVLSETRERTQDMADARTTIVLLHLRDIERKAGKRVSITSEILEIANRDLAAIAEADDFIVSNTLISLMVSQVAENPHLVDVFDELFNAGGYELYVKPATHYVREGKTTFATVCEAALRRDEIAIGYRRAASASDPESWGVVVGPRKQAVIELGPKDKIIVLAED
jgi:K+/H+ antiporter YhaU regulatory subunit KhtT